MANEFDKPNSENAAALQNMLGATNELNKPISRNAKILHNILGEQHEIEEPVGNIGKLLKQIFEQGTGGLEGGYTVKFKVNGSDYYIASCKQGESITEPPTPTVEGKIFGGWKLNDTFIFFPYTPNANAEITAYFSTKNFLAGNNETITMMRGFTFACKNLTAGNGFAGDKDLVGYNYGSDGKTGVILVTKVSRSNAIERTPSSLFANATNEVTYNGETYYYGRIAPFASVEADTSGLNRYKCSDGLTDEQAVTELLNAYFAD